MLTQKRLKELLKYNPDSGAFRWRVSWTRTRLPAGCIHSDGYRRIEIDGRRYLASRLAWLYMKGRMPENFVDHINRIRDDNRWANLRHVGKRGISRKNNFQLNEKTIDT